MVLSLPPFYSLLSKYKLLKDAHIVLLCPRGKRLTQSKVRELEKISTSKTLVFLCGHYEGIDERIKEFISEDISIGEYILSSGTLASSILIDAIVRLIPGVISEESLLSESFNTLDTEEDLDFGVYAPPRDFMGHKVPEILYTGNHKKIKKFRKG
ncbi:tRNA (guanine-N1)-methyltransferase [Plasmodium vivax North Korean]|uniref:tRNA (guanine-N(1)-)-methyltransferase n=1 Tax=Plasmodium vivax North Korean TaxID=1035514 RepID=A0A0J9TNL6_PLAVI|nr:tRNA (guanine-N1)-methyltransferase [Plasmodium vivax North Korean]